MEKVVSALSYLRVYINGCLCHTEPWQIVTITTTTVFTWVWMWQFIFQDESKYKKMYVIVRGLSESKDQFLIKLESSEMLSKTKFY